MPRKKATPAPTEQVEAVNSELDKALHVLTNLPSVAVDTLAEGHMPYSDVPPVPASDLSVGQTNGNASYTLLDLLACALIHQATANISPHDPETAGAVAHRVRDAYARAKIALEVRKEFI